MPDNARRIDAAALLAGAAAAAGQAAALRESLVLFSGFEPPAALLLCSWTLWTGAAALAAGRAHARRPPSGIGPELLLAGLTLPLGPGLLLAARPLFGLAPGEFPPLLPLLAVCLLAPALPALASGWCFARLWSLAAEPGRPPVRIYAAEAAGAALAGLGLTLALAAGLPLAWMVLAAALLPALAGASALFPRPLPLPRRAAVLLVPAALLLLAAFLPVLLRAARTSAYGTPPLAVLDTPRQQLALVRRGEQFTLFGNGDRLFSWPDPEAAQWAALPALLLSPRPARVLQIGGDPLGQAALTLAHPGLEELVLILPDPGVLDLCRAALPPEALAHLTDPRLRIIPQDPAQALRAEKSSFDAALLDPGDPVSAAAARPAALESLVQVRDRLAQGGLLTLAAPSGQAAQGPLQARRLRTLSATLAAAFPRVAAAPGPPVRFFAADEPGPPDLSPDLFLGRLAERGLAPTYFRAEEIEDWLSPFRRAALLALLAAPPPARPATLLEPAAFLDGLLLWGGQAGEGLRDLYLFLDGLPWSVFNLACWAAALALTPLLRRLGPAAAVKATVLTGGMAGMTLAVCLLLGCQALSGDLYGRLALITAGSMAGLGLGAALSPRVRARPMAGLFRVQIGLCLLLAATGPLLAGLKHALPQAAPVLLAVAALAGGTLGGLHFGLASRCLTPAAPAAAPGLGGVLYGLDLAGAAAGTLLAALWTVPLYGLAQAPLPPALLGLACALALGKRRGKR